MRKRAFTLVELMVVIAILVLLATIVLPMANHAYAVARRAALGADMQALVIAIDAYQHDFGDIPRPDGNVDGPFQGSCILVWALISPSPASFVSTGHRKGSLTMDGADGPGFRVRGTTGQVFGPYLALDHFRIGILGDPTTPIRVTPAASGIYDDSRTFLGDSSGNAILYWPRKLKVTISGLNNYFGPLSSSPAFVANDNDPGPALGRPSLDAGAIAQFQLRLPGVVADATGNPTLPDPTQALRVPYLLWDAGPDGRFCTDDDVTNFSQ